jgi:hypothetical protein
MVNTDADWAVAQTHTGPPRATLRSSAPTLSPCLCHTTVPKEVNQIFHTCAHDVQITYMANNKVNSSQYYDYNIIRVYILQNDPYV